MSAFLLEPLDTLFFRDGRPFNLGETGQMEVEGSFPPTPTTVVGALRAALARARGWNDGAWSEVIKQALGDGNDLAELRFHGPFVIREEQPLFPAPLLLMGKKDKRTERWTGLQRLVPGEPLHTDQGALRLPKISDSADGLKVLEHAYLTSEGMRRVLDGGVPASDDIIIQDALWQTEARVGIRRDPTTRTTPEDALYLSSHVRLCQSVDLGVSIDGLPDGWTPDSPAPLGGESRMAWISALENRISMPEPPTLSEQDGKVRYTVTLITPCGPSDDHWRSAAKSLFGLPGEIVSACVGKPQLIGGWDSLKHEPRPLRPHLPPGSTWFIEAETSEEQAIEDMHGGHIGKRKEWGYGQILIGTWEEIA